MRRMLAALLVLAAIFMGAMYATDSWIFAFAPARVDELTIIYGQTWERVQVSAEQASLILAELRSAAPYTTIIDIAAERDQYPVSHQLVTREGERQRVYYVLLEQGIVTDSDYQNLRQLGPETARLIAEMKPTLPGQLDLVVPDYVAAASGDALAYTRYILPVAYGSPDFRVYQNGTWAVDWDREVMILAAWGEQPGGGYSLRIDEVSIVDGWLKVAVSYQGPENTTAGGTPTCPSDAVLVERGLISGLLGACFVDQQGNLFASQALGEYPVERHLRPWPGGEALPLSVPSDGSGVLSSLVGDTRVSTLLVYYDQKATSQPVIKGVVETSQGNFLVYVGYEPGDARYDAVIISGFGSSWRFQVR